MEKSTRDKYTVVIGLEVHAQLLTKSKIYSSDSASYGSAPNTNVGVVTLAHPGTLPKLNKRVVEHAMKMGLACHSDISRVQIFDRKNYFYPDLPKGYQITQERTPVCRGGFIAIYTKDGRERKIGLNRIHIEEDAGKSIHPATGADTLVDFNRSGVPLIEIVTQPEIHTSEEAYALLTEIRKLVRYLDICDGNMEEGSLRCDANVSLMPRDARDFGNKVEVKNMNSIRNVQRAIEYEIERQAGQLERGEPVVSETRTFDANTGRTYSMRTKETLNDYRYFPDPDLSPLAVSDQWLSEVKSSMPPLPRELREKFVKVYHLSDYDSQVLTDSKEIAFYFEEVCRYTRNYKAASNWIMGPLKSYLNESGTEIGQLPISAERLAALISLVDDGKVNFAVASQRLFPAMLNIPDKTPFEIALQLNLVQDSNADSILLLVEQVIKEFPIKVEEFKSGKKGIMAMFMGEVMKRSNGKADPKIATQLLENKFKEQ